MPVAVVAELKFVGPLTIVAVAVLVELVVLVYHVMVHAAPMVPPPKPVLQVL